MAESSPPVNPFDDPEFAELRKTYRERKSESILVKAALEEPADKIYTILIKNRPLRFHRWTHEQANRLSELPFSHKLGSDTEELTEQEMPTFRAIQLELIRRAIIDKENWDDFLNDPENEREIEMIYLQIMLASMNTRFFTKKLIEFLSTDEGYRYGYFWFVIQKRLPHEIGSMPDSSVKAANIWLAKYGSKMIPG
jgi:hypothetical protein